MSACQLTRTKLPQKKLIFTDQFEHLQKQFRTIFRTAVLVTYNLKAKKEIHESYLHNMTIKKPKNFNRNCELEKKESPTLTEDGHN